MKSNSNSHKQSKFKSSANKPKSGNTKQFDNRPKISCPHCGYPHASENCRFKDLTCNNCGKQGHLKAVCRLKGSDKTLKNKGKRKLLSFKGIFPFYVNPETETGTK